MKNRVSALILTSAMVMGMFSGCGGGSDADKTSDTVTTASSREISDETTTSSVSADTSTASTTTTTENTTTTAQKTTEQTTQTEATTTTTANITTTKKITTTEEITTTAKTTQWYKEQQYDELSADNINDINYFLYYSEQFRLELFGGDVRVATYRYRDFYPEQDELDFRKECKLFMALINLDKLEKNTLKQIFIDYSDNDIKRCALAIRDLFLCFSTDTEYTCPDYDKYCVDEETREQLNYLKNKLLTLGNKKDIDSYYTEIYDPFFELTGEINASNAKPCMYYYYCLSEGNITMLTSKPLKYWEAEFIKLEDWIVSDLTKDTILNYTKGKAIGQYIDR